MATEKSQIDRVLDAGLYAPIGILLRREEALAEFAAAGRKQVAFCRSLGRAAIKGLARGAKPSASTRPTPGAQDHSIDGYADLTAKDVIALLTNCTDQQADWIAATERATKKRVTVLRAVDARG